jgi:predicted dehydrogenase
VKAAIIGAGAIAQQHIAALQWLGCESIVVCDRSRAIAEATSERFSLRNWYTDYEHMLDVARPDVVHVTTPPDSHVSLARTALESGAHVVVEKPIAVTYSHWTELRQFAEPLQQWLLEDQNYIFNRPVQTVLGLIECGEFGEVVHLDVCCCLAIGKRGSVFVDQNVDHPARRLPGGPIGDFLTHLASVAWVFVGAHRAVRTLWSKRNPESSLPSDEMRALVNTDRATATLCFSANGQPDGFWIRVQGTRMTAVMNLFEGTLWNERSRQGPRPLTPLYNGLASAWSMGAGTAASLRRKLSARPSSYEGLWELIRRTYEGLEKGLLPPVSKRQIDDVQRLVADLTCQEYKF